MTMVNVGERPAPTRRVRRKVFVGRHVYWVEFTSAGLTLREYGHRFTLVLPWGKALDTAEHLAGEAKWRERELARAARYASAGR